jgi:hypothetical protein
MGRGDRAAEFLTCPPVRCPTNPVVAATTPVAALYFVTPKLRQTSRVFLPQETPRIVLDNEAPGETSENPDACGKQLTSAQTGKVQEAASHGSSLLLLTIFCSILKSTVAMSCMSSA